MFSHVGFKAPNADIRVGQVTQTNELFKRTNNETNKKQKLYQNRSKSWEYRVIKKLIKRLKKIQDKLETRG